MIELFQQQRRVFWTAMMFLTRISCPPDTDHSAEYLARATVYFPVVGIIVGAIGASVYGLSIGLGYSPLVAAFAAIAATVLTTGAFHEDAFADVCDGFGGWTPEQRREILRDSRVGSFALVGMILMIGLKASLLSDMKLSLALMALPVAHALGRWSSVVLIYTTRYVADPASLAKPFAGQVTPSRLLLATLTTLLPTVILFGWLPAFVLFGSTLLLCRWADRFFPRWLGGLSGDCLGAINQVTELIVYTILIRMA